MKRRLHSAGSHVGVLVWVWKGGVMGGGNDRDAARVCIRLELRGVDSAPRRRHVLRHGILAATKSNARARGFRKIFTRAIEYFCAVCMR